MKKISLIFLLVILPALPPPLYPQLEPPRKLFAQGRELFSQGDLSGAEDLFLKTLAQDYLLADYCLYFLGTIASMRGASDSARGYFQQLKQRFPESLWSPHASLELGKISLAEKNYGQALAELRALQNGPSRNEVAREALFVIGQIHELQGELEQAYAVYRQLRRAAGGGWTAKARRELNRLRDEQPQLFALTAPEALAEEAELLFRERQFRQSEAIYRRLLELAPEGLPRPLLLRNLADVYRAARRRDEEIDVLAEIVREHAESLESPASLYRLARAYWNRNDDLKALDRIKELKERYPESPALDDAEFISARIYESLQKTDEAKRLYDGFAERFPNSGLRHEAEWRLAWLHYLQAEAGPARTAFKRLAEDAAAGRYKTAALYWQARAADKLGYAEEAKRIYDDIANGDEDSYYVGPASSRLKNMGGAVKQKKAAKPSNGDPVAGKTIARLGAGVSFHLVRARELSDIKLHRLAIAELDEIKNSVGPERSLQLVLMREYARNQAYDRSVSLANEAGTPYEEVLSYRYPLAYWDVIRKKAALHDVDPYLVVALIRQESLFDPNALSPASAHGLMQLLPSTAARVAGQLRLPVPEAGRLFDPELNITLGIYHLKELLRLYSNSVVKALAAYNAGENAVARWERDLGMNDEEEFIERIPYGETRLYVKLVLRNQLNYKKIYGGGGLDAKPDEP